MIAIGSTHTSEASLPASLRVAAEDSRRGSTRRALNKLADRLEQGVPLDQAWRDVGHLPEPIRAAREFAHSGLLLSDILAEMNESDARRKDVKRVLRRATFYPGMLLTGVFALFLFCDAFLLPAFQELHSAFDEFNFQTPALMGPRPIPGLYRIALVLLVALPVIWFALRGLLGPIRWRQAIIAMPVIGGIREYLELFPALRLLALLVDHGVALPQALRFTAAAGRRSFLSATLQSVAANIERGNSLARACLEADLPPMIIPLLAQGESAGRLGPMLRESAELLEAVLRQRAESLAILLPPVVFLAILVLVSSMVWGIVYSLFKAIRLMGALT